MPWDTNGRLVEAVDCASCNSSLEWHGTLPDDPAEWLCSACAEDAAYERGQRETITHVVAYLRRRTAEVYDGAPSAALNVAARLIEKGKWKENGDG